MSGDIIVFLGPSLPIEIAEAILSEAIFLPPAKCGDILHVTKLKPKKILLIDGYFESTPAVWHKEILYALEQGISVFGAASMGALRAAELDQYGMIGIGEIYKGFRDKVLIDDDEVAVAHFGDKAHYESVSDAMVNIRATLDQAVEKNVIRADENDNLIGIAKKIFYKERFLTKIIHESDIALSAKEALKIFIEKGGYCNQKAIDAENALWEIQRVRPRTSPAVKVPRSLYFRALLHLVSCEAFPYFSWKLPEEAQISCISRLIIPHYALLTKAAMLFSVISCMPGFRLEFEKWQTLIGTADDKEARIITGKELGLFYEGEDGGALADVIFNLLSLLISIILKKALALKLAPQVEHIQRFVDDFRRRKKLFQHEDFQAWLQSNSISAKRFEQLATYLVLIEFLVYRHNDDVLETLPNQTVEDWYFFALKVLGLSDKIKQTLEDNELRRKMIEKAMQDYQEKGEEYLLSHGFNEAEEFEMIIQDKRT